MTHDIYFVGEGSSFAKGATSKNSDRLQSKVVNMSATPELMTRVQYMDRSAIVWISECIYTLVHGHR